ncbi:hypothetical protein H4S01_005398 [Coemansia sp. RSA 2610]|nr:hypothetical protein H4S01_005398 [Coemansia sp. RSA 2610]
MSRILSRAFATSLRQRSSDGKLTFLDPKINPHGQWAEPAEPRTYPPPIHPRPTPVHAASLWTLDERRALFMYVQAVQAHLHRDPDWPFVGQRLDRLASECELMYRYIFRNWRRHKQLTRIRAMRTDAGASVRQLLGDIDGIATTLGTRMWLRRLADPPEPALAMPLASHHAWTAEDDAQLLLERPLLADIRVALMPEYILRSGRTVEAVRKRFMLLQEQHRDAGRGARALDAGEKAVVAAAVERRRPLPVRWRDVAEQLPGRAFFDVYNQINSRYNNK